MKFQQAIEEVRSRSDIAEIVGSVVPLKRAGRNFKGLCPFHAEKTPSFTVSADKQLFYCFGCNVGGDLFEFVMKLKHYSFKEALEYLAGRLGITIEPDYTNERDESLRRLKSEFLRVNQAASQYFHALLVGDAGKGARSYLASRGITTEDIKRFQLGLTLDSWDGLANHLAKQGFSSKRVAELGLIAPRASRGGRDSGYYDKFRARIMFPILDLKRQTVGFGGRLFQAAGGSNVQNMGKYINSAQSSLFDKSKTFYLLDQAEESMRQTRQAVVVEGYMDAIALHQKGITNVVATLGTALTAVHAKLLSRLVDRVVTLFDADEAGKRAAKRALQPLLASGVDAAVVLLPEGEDPDTFVKSKGSEALKERLEKARDLLDFCVDDAKSQADSKRETANRLEEIARIVVGIPNRIQRDLYIQALRARTGISADAIKSMKIKDKVEYQQPDNAEQQKQRKTAATTVVRGEEEMLLCLAFDSENVYELLRTYEGPPLFSHPLMKDIAEEQVLAGEAQKGDLSRLMETIQDAPLKSSLQRCLLEVEQLGGEEQLRAARDCIRKILKRKFEMRMQELSRKITVAEKQANATLVNDLLREKRELIKSVHQDL